MECGPALLQEAGRDSWALGHFLMASLGLLPLLRYRTMVPLMYLVFTLENVGRKVLQLSPPRATSSRLLLWLKEMEPLRRALAA